MSSFGFLPNGTYLKQTALTSDIYANDNLEMNNYTVNNVRNSIESEQQSVLNRYQGYRVGEIFFSPCLTLTQIYPDYLLACQGQTFDQNLPKYQTLYQRLGTNVLPNILLSNDILIYDGVPNSGNQNNFVAFSWDNIINNCQYLEISSQNTNRQWFTSIKVPVEFMVTNNNNPSYYIGNNVNILFNTVSRFVMTISQQGSSNAFDFTFQDVVGLRLRISMVNIKTGPLERLRPYIIAA